MFFQMMHKEAKKNNNFARYSYYGGEIAGNV